jgi:serine/threonine protein kinase
MFSEDKIDMPPAHHQFIINNTNNSSSSKTNNTNVNERSANLIAIDLFSDILVDYDISNIVLGKGSTALVRECTERLSGAKYAVKTIDKNKTTSDLILHEVQTLSTVDHPNIIKMIDYYEDKNSVHIITELYSGGDLYNVIMNNISDRGCLPEDEAIEIIQSILESVEYLHKKDIVHRDIKPENILIYEDKHHTHIKLIDFGLSRTHTLNDGYMTEMVGTAYYMSPGVLLGQYDRSCDLWSVGVVSYILLCGYPPFNGHYDHEIHSATIGQREVVFDSIVWDNLSNESKEFVSMMLRKDASCKPVSASEALLHPWLRSR